MRCRQTHISHFIVGLPTGTSSQFLRKIEDSLVTANLFYSLLLRSGVDTPIPREPNFEHNIRPTQQNDSSQFSGTGFVNVNITNTGLTPNP